MEIKEVSSLRPRDVASPIQIRVVRRWNPPFRDNVTCFLLVDKHGDGIQANAHGKDQKYTEENLLQELCYTVEGYACIHPEPYVNTLSHPANLRIGDASTFTPIPETEELPRHYFEFASRRKLDRLCGSSKEVIDFIGLLVEVGDRITNSGRPYVRLLLKDSSDQNIEVALWEEISKTPGRFNRVEVEGSTHPAVIAVTAMKVKDFSNMQLWSTRATYVYLNPNCLETKNLIDSFNKKDTTHKGSVSNRAIIVVTENKTTIADLIKKDSEELMGQTFSFNGAVTQITSRDEWCHTICLKCGSLIYPSGDQLFCTKDGAQNKPKYIYRISVIISDNTGRVNATLFDEAVKGMVGIGCTDMIIREAYTDMESIPAPLLSIEGKIMKFHTQAQKDACTGNVRCTVNRVSEAHVEDDHNLSTPKPQTPQPPAAVKIQSTSTAKRGQLFQEGTRKKSK